MPPALVALIEPYDVAGLKVLHEAAEIGVGRFDHQVGVIVHQAVEVQDHSVPQDARAQGLHKPATIVVIADK